MFNWLKRLLSDPPAASLPGDIASPPPVVQQSEDERIEKAKKLLDEAIYTLWGCGVSYFDMEGMISDALDRYSDDDDEDDDEWFSGEDDDDDEHDDGCSCPDCNDAYVDFNDDDLEGFEYGNK